MNKRILGIIILIIIIVGVVVVSQGKEPSTARVKIGVLSPLTGSFAALGEDFSAGVHIAAEENRDIELIQEDTASDPKIAISAMNKLMTEGVKIFIAGPGSSVNLALAPIAEQNKVLLLAQSKTAKMDEAGEYVFRTFPLLDIEAEIMAGYMYNKSIKSAAIIFDSSSDTTIMAKNSFEKKFTSLGGNITIAEGFDSKSVKDFRTILLKVKNSHPGAIYLALTENPSGPMMKQIKAMSITAPLFGWSVHDTQRMIETAGDSVEGLIFSAESFVCTRDESTKKYCDAYVGKTASTTAQYYGAYGYDTLNIVADLLQKSGGDIEKVKTGLSGISNYKGVVGAINTNSTGNVERTDFVLKTFKEGKIVNI